MLREVLRVVWERTAVDNHCNYYFFYPLPYCTGLHSYRQGTDCTCCLVICLVGRNVLPLASVRLLPIQCGRHDSVIQFGPLPYVQRVYML